jgi:hypothetical protein
VRSNGRLELEVTVPKEQEGKGKAEKSKVEGEVGLEGLQCGG